MINQISWMSASGLSLALIFLPTVAEAEEGVKSHGQAKGRANTLQRVLKNPNNPPQVKKPSVKFFISQQARKRRKPPSDYSRAGGSRGCPGEAIPLTVLAPNTFVGKTTLVYPTFAWFVAKPQTTEFRLFKLDAKTSIPKRVGGTIEVQSKSGINKLSLSQKQAALAVGGTYIWQVSIDCPDGPFIKRAEFEVVQKPSTLDNRLSKVKNYSQRASIFKQEDFWYEALQEALKTAPQGKLGQLGSSIVQNLALEDNLTPETLTSNRLEALKKEIHQRKKHLESIAERN